MDVALTDSASLVAVPLVDEGNAVHLTHESYGSWAQMFDENPAQLDYLLAPGNYRPWGRLEIVNRPGNTGTRPKTIRYDPGVGQPVHPVQRSTHVRIAEFLIAGADTQDWLLQGLTVSGPCHHPAISQGASNITIDMCLIEYVPTYCMRIRYASYCTVQRCVIREAINDRNNQGPGDSVGIQIGNVDADVVGIRVLDNEIYNVGDGIQVTDGPEPIRPVEVLIEGNDLYLEASRYIGDTNTTWDENAIDLKAGSDAPESTVIRGNRMWGMRRNAVPTARGEILVLQRYARKVLVEDNIMGEAPRGMADGGWPDDSPMSRNVTFRRNQFYEIRDYAAQDAGAVTKPITSDISFLDNHVARSDCLADRTPPDYRGSGPVYEGNTLVEVKCLQRLTVPPHPSLPYDPAMNTVADAPNGYDSYQRKRWTGPELAFGAVPADG
jgi:hypothetical protein